MKSTAEKANYDDLAEILALQKLAFLSEAAIYDDLTVPPLTQTLPELQTDFFKKTILKIVCDDKIVGSVRASFDKGVVHIERVMVHPDYQKLGLGYVLMDSIERSFEDVKMFKLFTGYKSFGNINWYQKLGYKITGDDKVVSPKLKITRLIKNVHKTLKIKVCGMREINNINALLQLPIDYMGFIFYEKSARYVQSVPDLTTFEKFPNVKKVGVFVNAEVNFVLKKVGEFGLNVVQLHGKETPQYLEELKIKNLKLRVQNRQDINNERIINNGRINSPVIDDALVINGGNQIEIWKVFSVDETFDFNETEPFEGSVDKFLFDTKTPLHGGSGEKFDWEILKKYEGKTPFFLSGGISAADTEGVKNIQHPQLFGLDVNSKFEISPALKDVPMLRKFLFSLDLL